VATEFYTVASNICWSRVRNLLRFTPLAPRIVKWLFDFQKICAPLHYDEFRFSDLCKARYVFSAPDKVPAKGRAKCGTKNYLSPGALYRKLPIVCFAFLFELVTSCSAYKCSYYQTGVNTFSKVIVCCFRLLVVKLSDAFRSVLIAPSFRFIFVLVLYSVL
jgi:hypothetical protein